MKTSVIFLASMFIATLSFAQGQTLYNSEAEVIDPMFCANDKIIQGETYKTIDEFLSKNIVYPALSISCKTQGTEVVRFTVNTSGELTNFTVINSVCKKMDEEVIKVLELTDGMWQSGTINGNPVAMVKEVSVVFNLHCSNNFVAMAKSYLKKGNKMLFKKSNPKKALKCYDMGINLLPNNETLLAARGLCKFKMGDKTGAILDWERVNTRKDINSIDLEKDNLVVNAVQIGAIQK
jgi:hypothetical protein